MSQHTANLGVPGKRRKFSLRHQQMELFREIHTPMFFSMSCSSEEYHMWNYFHTKLWKFASSLLGKSYHYPVRRRYVGIATFIYRGVLFLKGCSRRSRWFQGTRVPDEALRSGCRRYVAHRRGVTPKKVPCQFVMLAFGSESAALATGDLAKASSIESSA